MRRLNRSKDFVSTLPKEINQKLVDGYRVKLFAKIKDSLDKDRIITLNKEELEFKKWLENKNFINQPINNGWFNPYIGA